MNKWLVRVGISLIVVALISVSPIVDLLPVDWWYSLSRVFSEEGEVTYFKVVSSTPNYTPQIILAVAGISLVFIGKLTKSKVSKKNDN